MQSETPTYPALIANLFAPKQPVKYLPPIDYPTEQRRLPNVTPIGSLMEQVKQYNEEVKYESTEGVQQKEQRLRKEKISKQKEQLARDLLNWDPSKDPHIQSSDPYKTLFVGRLDYKVTEVELQQFFSKYGTIKKLRLVRDKSTSESKGYAFVEFESEQICRACYKDANGQKIMDRTILVDFERSRLIKNWKPTRLGGGLGGRHYTKMEKEREQRMRDRQNKSARGGYGRNTGLESSSRYGSESRSRYHHDRAPYDRNAPRYNSRGRGSYRRGGSSYRGRY